MTNPKYGERIESVTTGLLSHDHLALKVIALERNMTVYQLMRKILLTFLQEPSLTKEQ